MPWSLAAINTVPQPQIQFLKNRIQIPPFESPTPHKNFKKFQGTMSNVGHGIIKKDPRTSADVPGAQGGFPQGEAMNKKNLHHCRKEVYTNCNEAASATPAQFLRNARTSN
jgi:hypothetical protein